MTGVMVKLYLERSPTEDLSGKSTSPNSLTRFEHEICRKHGLTTFSCRIYVYHRRCDRSVFPRRLIVSKAIGCTYDELKNKLGIWLQHNALNPIRAKLRISEMYLWDVCMIVKPIARSLSVDIEYSCRSRNLAWLVDNKSWRMLPPLVGIILVFPCALSASLQAWELEYSADRLGLHAAGALVIFTSREPIRGSRPAPMASSAITAHVRNSSALIGFWNTSRGMCTRIQCGGWQPWAL